VKNIKYELLLDGAGNKILINITYKKIITQVTDSSLLFISSVLSYFREDCIMRDKQHSTN
jgi:hypothetical protein